jgi:hypothetical protein
VLAYQVVLSIWGPAPARVDGLQGRLELAGAGLSAQRLFVIGASIAALVVLTALLGGGAWAGYQAYVRSTPQAVGNDFLPDPSFGGGRRARVAQNAAPRPPVEVLPGQVIRVSTAGLMLNATGRPDGSWRLNFYHRGGGPAPDAQAAELLSLYRRKIIEPKRPAAELKLTDAQKSALAALPANPPELAQADADRAIELCKQLVKTPAADAKAQPLKQELEQIVQAAAKGDRGAIVATYAQRAQQIRTILSPEQVQTLLTGAAKPAAAPKPSTRPV